MKPLNQPERRKAFLNFLLLFVITMMVIITTVFFSIQVPLKENKKLRDQIATNKKLSEFTDEFIKEIANPQIALETLGNDDTTAIQVESEYRNITSILGNVQALQDSVSKQLNDTRISDPNYIYGRMYHAFSDLASAKYTLAKSEKQSQETGKYEAEINSLKIELNSANNHIDSVAKANNLPSVQF